MFRSVIGNILHKVPAPGPLGWVVSATFLHFMSFYYLLATLPLYVLDLGGSTFQVGLIVGVFALTSLGTRPLFGAWMDRAGRKRFLLAGAAIFVLASLGYDAIRSVPALLLWRVFHGLGLATFSTAAASLAGDLAPARRRGTTMGIYSLAQAGALGVGPGIGTALQRAIGYSGLFLATACTALGALACVLPIPAAQAGQPVVRAPEAGATKRRVWAAAAAPAALQFAASIAYGSIVTFIALVARERGLDVVGTYFALLAISSLGIRLVAGRAYDVWGPRAVLVPAFLALATGMGVLAFTAHPGLFLGTAVLAGAGIGATHAGLLARVIESSPAEGRGRAVAVFISCWELGAGGATILMGRLAEVTGFSGMYVTVAALSLSGLAGLPYLRQGPAAAPPDTDLADRA